MPDYYEAICQVCRKPIDDKKGYLWMDMTKAYAVQHAHNEYDLQERVKNRENLFHAINWEKMFALPRAAKWQCHHEACDPSIDAEAYVIEVERIRTPKDLLHWTAHLMEKSWFGHTNWKNLIDNVYGHGILRNLEDPWRNGTPGHEEF